MKDYIYPKTVKRTRNRLYPLYIPAEMIYGLQWDDVTGSTPIFDLQIEPMPEESGFMVRCIDRNPINEIAYILGVGESRKDGRTKSNKSPVKADKFIPFVHKLPAIPKDFKNDSEFKQLWTEYKESRDNLSKAHQKFKEENKTEYNKMEKTTRRMAELMEKEWSKKKIFLIHGAFGNPNDNWFPWLKKKLEQDRHEVIAPVFPTPKGQNLENWMKVFNKYLPELDDNTILIGHSLAPAFILNVLGKIRRKVHTCIFVAGFTNLLGNPTFDEINKTFVDKKFDWSKLKKRSKNFLVYVSDNDPYVPKTEGEFIAKKLGAKIINERKAGHFNKDAGYTKFENLYNDFYRLLEE